MIQYQGRWVVEEDEIIHGEYGEMVDKKIADTRIAPKAAG